MRSCLAVFLLVLAVVFGTGPAYAQSTDAAFDSAVAQFEAALPDLPGELFGVDVSAYRDALTLRRFASRYWGGSVSLAVQSADAEADPSCGRFAAFVRLPPQNGTVTLVLCPQFSTQGADALRRLTVLHEMVHVVAGPDECRAMAFAARIEFIATGQFTPVQNYWQSNNCQTSAFELPN